MRVQFWGTRGSISRPGPGTLRYGGNTSCVSVTTGDGTRLVLDCGTGAYALGQSWMAAGGKLRGHILIGHTHWDHIQGIPFFAPLFVPGNEFDIYAPRGVGPQLRETLAGQMQYTYFPVALEQLGATLHYHDLGEEKFDIGRIAVRTRYLNHPAVTLAYRVEVDGLSMVYATDHEPHGRPLGPGGAVVHRPLFHPEDLRHAAFMAGADLLVHDSQYLLSEYGQRVGWGHSTLEYVIDVALAAGVRRLALFHHDPMRKDHELDGLVARAQAEVVARGGDLIVFAAAEGQAVDLVPPEAGDPREAARRRAGPGAWLDLRAAGRLGAVDVEAAARSLGLDLEEDHLRLSGAPGAAPASGAIQPATLPAPPSRRIVVALPDAELIAAVERGLGADGYVIEAVPDTEAAVERAVQTRPALVIMPRLCGQASGIAATDRLRSSGDATVRQTPVVIVGTPDESGDMEEAFAAGASDWLTRPCSPAFIQSRLRSWLGRLPIRWLKPPLAPDEDQRLADLQAMGVVGTSPEERFDRLARMTAYSLQAQFCFVSFMERERQWFKACIGKEVTEIPRDISMCGYVVLQDEPVVVEDAVSDDRYGDNPAFHDATHRRFYAGIPLHGPGGYRVGALCVYDPRPRTWQEADRQALVDLAALTEEELRKG